MKTRPLRKEGRLVEALLILLKQLTAHARWGFAIVLALYAVSGIHTIEPHEQALVVRFGRLLPEVRGPGLLVGFPAPFDRVSRFETGKEATLMLDGWALSGLKTGGPDRPSVVTPDSAIEALGIPDPRDSPASSGGAPPPPAPGSLDPESQGYTLTADTNLVQGRFALRYRIEDPFRYTVAGESVKPLLQALGYRALAAGLAARGIDVALTSERSQLADFAVTRIQREVIELNLGVRISGLDILELSPPSQVLAAFEDVVNARQFSKTLHEKALQDRAEALAKNSGECAALLHGARGETDSLTHEARGESSAFLAMLARYRLDPERVSGGLLSGTLETVMPRVQSRTLLPAGRTQPSLILEPLPADSR